MRNNNDALPSSAVLWTTSACELPQIQKKIIILQVSCLDIKGYDSYFFTFLKNKGPFVSPKKLVSFSRYSVFYNFPSQTFFLWKNETIMTPPYILHKLTNAIFGITLKPLWIRTSN